MTASHFAALSITGLLLLTGCASLTDRDQPTVAPDKFLTLEPGSTVGQTFVARHGGLDGIEFWLATESGARGRLWLHMRSDPQSGADLAVAVKPLEEIVTPGFYRFTLPPDGRSHGSYRYVFLSLEGDGKVWLGAAPGNVYTDGSAYENHEPIDAQLAFQLTYNPTELFVELGNAVREWAGLLAIAALLYVVPGYGALSLCFSKGSTTLGQNSEHSDWFLAWPAQIGIAIGVSLAIYPLLLLWTNAVGLRLGPLYAWAPVVLGLVAIAWGHRQWRPAHAWDALKRWRRRNTIGPDLAYAFILVLVLGSRLIVIRTLEAPMWGDSYQHTVIAQLLVDHGGLFDSWEPYTPYRGLTVHYGFSVASALLAWTTGLDATRATLLTGQLINAAAVLAVYPLALRLANGNRWAGVGAVLIAGLISPMPAYYVNWGRFAQLAGQAILPVALGLLWATVDEKRISVRALLLAAITLSGMLLHYYRMPFYYATFVLAWLLAWALPTFKLGRSRWLGAFAGMSLVALLGVLFLLPLGSRLVGGALADKLEAGLVSQAATSLERIKADYQSWRDITRYVPLPLLGAVLFALVLSLARRQQAVVVCALWVAGLASLVATRLIRLPGANLMQNFAVLIALYLPVGLAIGWLFGEVVVALDKIGERFLHKPRLGQVTAVFACCALGVVGLLSKMRIVEQRYNLVTRPDTRAMAWIREHTPADARFLVEGFRIYNGQSVVGADAGWWIPLLANRANTMPPQYAILNETPAEPGYSERLVELVAHLEEHAPASPAGLARLCEWGITHIYIGQGQGEVGAGAKQLFAPADFVGSSAFQPVYRQDRVWIFALNPAACTQAR
ncbi:MAG: hypothetical protein ACK4WM_10380 [Thermoflexales bacterium]